MMEDKPGGRTRKEGGIGRKKDSVSGKEGQARESSSRKEDNARVRT